MRLFLLATLCACGAAAQGLTEPPTLVRLIRRQGLDTQAARRYAEARAPVNVFGLTAVTGFGETWLLEAHDAFAGIEALDRVLRPFPTASAAPQAGDEALPPAASWVALCRPQLSYRADQAIRAFPKAHYFHVSVFRIRPGTEADFVELIRARRQTLDAINLDRPDIAYQVISGAPSGTYVVFAPLTSLKVLDDALPHLPAYAEPAAKAAGKAAAEGDVTREHLLFRVEPSLSWVSDEVAGGDPEFWRK